MPVGVSDRSFWKLLHMSGPVSACDARDCLSLLTEPGTIGFYTHVEATEIVAFEGRSTTPVNVFTLLVAEDRDQTPLPDDAFLNPRPIRVPSLKGWSFGLRRYYRPLDAFVAAIGETPSVRTWSFSGHSLAIGKLRAQPPPVVPPDTYLELPWNRVLKNNFWNGSYVVEWHDPVKVRLVDLFARPQALQELTEQVRTFVPVGIAALSDRLGNIVLQLPLTVLMARFSLLRSPSGMRVDVGWHPKASPRQIRAQTVRSYDGVVAGFASGPVVGESAILPAVDSTLR